MPMTPASELARRLRAYLRQLAPHQQDREAAKLIEEAAALLESREGWVMVPREPTEEMSDVGAREGVDAYHDMRHWVHIAPRIYKAMLAAAPAQEGGRE